jgi:hypothetical protein
MCIPSISELRTFEGVPVLVSSMHHYSVRIAPLIKLLLPVPDDDDDVYLNKITTYRSQKITIHTKIVD